MMRFGKQHVLCFLEVKQPKGSFWSMIVGWVLVCEFDCVCLSVCVCVCVRLCVYVCVCVCVYLHTHCDMRVWVFGLVCGKRGATCDFVKLSVRLCARHKGRLWRTDSHTTPASCLINIAQQTIVKPKCNAQRCALCAQNRFHYEK